MNNPLANLVTAAELRSLRDDVAAVVGDSEAGGTVVTFTTSSTAGDDVDLSTGAVTPDEATDNVSAALTRMVKDEGQGVQTGDVGLLIDASELRTKAIADPAAADRLTIAATEYEIVAATIDPTESLWNIQARAVESQ